MINLIFSNIHYFSLTIIISILVFIAYVFYKDNKGNVIEKLKLFIRCNHWLSLFILYSSLMMTVTIIARTTKNPFANIIGYFWYDGWGEFNYVGLLNILLFIPYIILYILAFRPEKVFTKSIHLTVLTTFFIETYQLLFWVGQFSLADIIHNTFGGMIGYGMWHLVTRIVERIEQRNK